LENNAINFTHLIENGDGAEIKAAKSYIRMNARGKALEPFENLKAMIDSIDGKLHTELGFTKRYDSEYIDTLYSNCSDFALEIKTAKINRESLNYLKNIYNLNCQLKGKDTLSDEAKFISEIYDYSQKNLSDEEKGFFNDYFGMIIAVFDYFKNEPNDTVIKNVLEDKDISHASDNKSIVAAVLYIYYFYKSNSTVLAKEQFEKYNYVLYNLNLAEWSAEYLESIDNFANAVAKSGDVFDYFYNTDLTDIRNTCIGVLEDIVVRIKEQKIKVNIIKSKGLSWNYFDELEKQSGVRKIQYLLYLSGYWGDLGDYKKLSMYINIAKAYLNLTNRDLEWRKIFAIAAHLDCKNELMSQKNINENCGSKHIWHDKFLFWNDEEDENLSTSKPQLEVIKIAYDEKKIIDNLIIIILSNGSEYDNCWLKYAIKYNCKELLDKELIWDSDNGIVKLKDYGNYRYDMYIMCIINGKQYGLKNLTETAKSQYEFDNNSKYTHSDGIISFTTGDRKFIMRLNIPISITKINENYDQNKCLYFYDMKKYCYKIYMVNSPYEFKNTNYDISTELQEQKVEYNKQLTILKDYKADNYLEIKEGKKQEWQQDGRSSIWKKEIIQICFNGNFSCEQLKLYVD